MRRSATLRLRSIDRPEAFLSLPGSPRHFLGRWETEALASLARDRAILYFRASHLKLHDGARARHLGPASPEELRRLAKIAYKRVSATSRYHGVSYNNGTERWDAYVRDAGVRLHIGSFAREKDAAIAVDRLCRHLGSTSVLNFPSVALAPASLEELKARAHRRRKQQTTSRYVGPVYTDGLERPWFFYMLGGGEHTSVGGYATDREAALAHDRAALYYHEAPFLNFPDQARALGPADFDTLRREAHAERKGSMTSRYRGVSYYSARACWTASIYVGRTYHLGYFNREEDAARAYDEAAIRLRGADYRINFPADARSTA